MKGFALGRGHVWGFIIANAAALALLATKRRARAPRPPHQELRVATASDPKVIAGAIGAHLRSHDPVRVTVMGPNRGPVMPNLLALRVSPLGWLD